MTPQELYHSICLRYQECEVDSICQTEKTCKRNGFCNDKQHHGVIDFDKVKDTYYDHQGVDKKPASVDAVCVGDQHEHFCFVELKGWKNYMAHRSQQKKNVEETAADYNLVGKLRDSQRLCMELTSNPDLFANMPIVFLLVTDIDVNENGLEWFADRLTDLATSSSSIYSECISNSRKTLDSEIHIQHDYIYCKDFDKHLETI